MMRLRRELETQSVDHQEEGRRRPDAKNVKVSEGHDNEIL